MNVLCTICARKGSKGVKNKNYKKLKGKPLIAHTISQAKQSGLFNCITISTDSIKISKIATEWGINDIIKRPSHLASATVSKLPAIQHAVLNIENKYQKQFDYIIDLDVTSPLRLTEDIQNAFELLINNPLATNLVTACPSRKSPYFNMLELSNGVIKLIKQPSQVIVRRQDAPACYDMNASIYIWRRKFLFELENIINEKTLLYIMPEERSIDIDSILDWQLVKILSKNRKDL